MKKLILTTVLMISLSVFVARAQDNPMKNKTFFSYDWEMTKLLGFTPEQVKSWKEIHANADPEINRVKGDTSLSEKEKTEKLNILWGERYKKHEALLTPEQKIKAEEFKQIIRKQNQEAKDKLKGN